MELPSEVKGYTLINPEKVERALNGSPNSKGIFVGGVVKEDGTFDDDALLAEYDRLGGLIKRGSDTVKTGSFYDFKNKRPRKDAEVVFVYRVNGRVVEVSDGVELPGEVKAVKILAEMESADKKTKKGKK